MKIGSSFIFLLLLGIIGASDTCYKYNYYSNTYYTTYCRGYCAGALGSEYCLYYYYNAGESGSTTVTIGASVGGSIGGLIFLCLCFACIKKS